MNAESAAFPPPQTNAGRISYLDGVRGFAALQVVLVHYLLFFLPAQKCSRFWFCWAQALREMYLFFPVDGYMAVSLFFLLSGYVLTKSFAKTRDKVLPNVIKRWIRLQIPVFFALALAFVLVLLCGGAFLEAAELNGSASWAKDFFVVPATFESFLKESFWTALVAGYENISVFAGFGGHLFSDQQSLDVPLWSLNIEFWGSMLIIALAWLRPRPLTHQIALVFCFGIFCMNSLVLFLVGHALAITETDERPFIFKKARTGNIVGGALVVFGILLSTWREDAMPLNLFVELDSIVYFPAQSPFHFIGMIAAIFIFLGIYAAPGLRAFFALRLWQKLGRISFALYLLHFPMLLTVTAVLQVWLDGFFIYPVAAVAAFIVGLTITYMAAVLFTKWIDDPAIRLGRFVESPRLIFSASRSS